MATMDNHLRQRSPGDHNTDGNDGDRTCSDSSAATGDPHPPLRMSCPAGRRGCARLHAGSVSNLCSATLGAGALSLPYAMSLTGIVLGIFLLIFSAYLTIISIDGIVDACVRTRLFKYEDVSLRLVGPSAGKALEASLLIFCFGTAVAYIAAVGDILDEGLRSIPHLWESDEFKSIYSRERVMVLFWTLVMFPLSLQRNVEALERFSSLGVFSIIFLVMAAVIHSVDHGDVLGGGAESKPSEATDMRSMLWPKSFWDVVVACPIVVFAFSCQVNVCAIYEELEPDDAADLARREMHALEVKQHAMKRITRSSIALCVTLYVCIGLFGFLDFSDDTGDNILTNYCIQKTHDPLMIAASVFVAVAVVVAFPFNILPARVTLKLILERLRRRCGRRTLYDTPNAMDGASLSSGEPLLDDDRFGDRQSHLPHMSLEGMPREVPNLDEDEVYCEGEVYSTESSPVEHFLLTLFLSGSALFVALRIPGISVVFGLMGGTAASIISFILPGMFLMKDYAGVTGEEMSRRSERTRLCGLFFVVAGSLMGILSTGTTIYGLFCPDETGSSDICGKI